MDAVWSTVVALPFADNIERLNHGSLQCQCLAVLGIEFDVVFVEFL